MAVFVSVDACAWTGVEPNPAQPSTTDIARPNPAALKKPGLFTNTVPPPVGARMRAGTDYFEVRHTKIIPIVTNQARTANPVRKAANRAGSIR
ncbi:hypothetical protein LDO26_04365 [Luteimonas sp. BDR2-5]|uniref:hypothetical protein n=1 Tax=Proluteimonas luteida TaxID=2878685 RepID=UPI001E532752|nr:hypothetical protein [Luteimonas sp. BDR2-5]MCD9027448.1 hypothetical protein [Luteimonas sp. BDR2-5]